MRLYAVINSSGRSDFPLEDDFGVAHSSNSHSGAMVILAEDQKDALNFIPKGASGSLREIPFDQAGLVVFADGDC